MTVRQEVMHRCGFAPAVRSDARVTAGLNRRERNGEKESPENGELRLSRIGIGEGSQGKLCSFVPGEANSKKRPVRVGESGGQERKQLSILPSIRGCGKTRNTILTVGTRDGVRENFEGTGEGEKKRERERKKKKRSRRKKKKDSTSSTFASTKQGNARSPKRERKRVLLVFTSPKPLRDEGKERLRRETKGRTREGADEI